MEEPALLRERQMERRRMIITCPLRRQGKPRRRRIRRARGSREQERFKCRLIATANSLKKKQQQLQADQDLLADRWTEVLAAEEYKLERPSKSYPKCRLLPRLEEEAYDTIGHLVAAIERHSTQKLSLHPDAIQIKRAWGDRPDLRDILEDKAKNARSIYRSRGCTTLRDDKRHAGYSKSKSGRAEHSG